MPTIRDAALSDAPSPYAGSLLSYPGEFYKDLRHRTFTELWPEFFKMDMSSEQEADPGEYYLDTLAVLPEFRRRGIGRALLEDGIRKGISQGFDRITLMADSEMPHLIRLYESIGFRKADIRHVFGVEFQRMVLYYNADGESEYVPEFLEKWNFPGSV